VIRLRAQAPAMPAAGAACNGCGVCCAWAPCPLGIVVSGRRTGRCRALRWDRQHLIYRCAMVASPRRVWPWWPGWAEGLLRRLARRWISASSGCDADLAVEP
jgi:hypothetical protein